MANDNTLRSGRPCKTHAVLRNFRRYGKMTLFPRAHFAPQFVEPVIHYP